jgi:membrane-associated protease RseP (regulator of RpoE activity)
MGFGLAIVGVTAGALLLSPTTGARASDGGEGWLGVSLQELSSRLREAMDLDEDVEGALVARVVRGSPASKAGIREGDVIVEIDDKKIDSVDEAVDAVRSMDPGEKVLVVVDRRGKQRGLSVVLGTREEGTLAFVPEPEDRVDEDVRDHYMDDRRKPRARAPSSDKGDWVEAPEGENRWEDDEGNVIILRKGDKDRVRKRIHVAPRIAMQNCCGGFLGVRTMSLGEQLAEYFGVSEDEGVLVTDVVENSPAEDAGLEAGDVILAVGDEDVSSPSDLRRAIRDHEPEDEVAISVIRKGSRMTLNVKLGNTKDFGNAIFIGPDAHMVMEIPDIPEILAPHLETLHLQLEELPELLELHELEDLEHLEILGPEHLDHIAVYLDGHRKHLKHLKKEMKHLKKNLREIHLEFREKHREHWKEEQARRLESREQRREWRNAWRQELDARREAGMQAREAFRRAIRKPRRAEREARGEFWDRLVQKTV